MPIFKENMLKLQRPVLPLVYKADLAHSPFWQGPGGLSHLWRSFSAPSPPPAWVRLQHTPSPPKWHTETPRSHRLMRIPQHTDTRTDSSSCSLAHRRAVSTSANVIATLLARTKGSERLSRAEPSVLGQPLEDAKSWSLGQQKVLWLKIQLCL